MHKQCVPGVRFDFWVPGNEATFSDCLGMRLHSQIVWERGYILRLSGNEVRGPLSASGAKMAQDVGMV